MENSRIESLKSLRFKQTLMANLFSVAPQEARAHVSVIFPPKASLDSSPVLYMKKHSNSVKSQEIRVK